LIGYLPRYAPIASKASWIANLRDIVPGAARVSETFFGFSAKRTLPKWSAKPFTSLAPSPANGRAGDRVVRTTQTAIKANISDSQKTLSPVFPSRGEEAVLREVVLFTDTFNNYFEPQNLAAARRVLESANYVVQIVCAKNESRPLCCGRTFLATGMIDEAKKEARRTIDALLPFVNRGVAVVGLEPSCLLTLRDEFISILPGAEAEKVAANAFLLEEYLMHEKNAGRLSLDLRALDCTEALLHGHCHQKAFDAMTPAEEVLSWVPDLKTTAIESSCCGMAGAFGYEAAHFDVSMKMGELSLLPQVRNANAKTLIVADGTSCRHQIADGAKRDAIHVAIVLERALKP
jgi:Fe-S oxidoreductase